MKKPYQSGNIEFVKLERAWLEAYTAWLKLNAFDRQLYKCPEKPLSFRSKYIIKVQSKDL